MGYVFPLEKKHRLHPRDEKGLLLQGNRTKEKKDPIDFGKLKPSTAAIHPGREIISSLSPGIVRLLSFLKSAFMLARFIHFVSLTALSAWGLTFVQSSGCLGCNNKLNIISSVNEPLKGKKFESQTATKPRISKDFWTTSACDMDNSAIQSRGSISSTSTPAQMHDSHDAGSSENHSEFVNHGLLLWNQTRQQWIGSKKPVKNSKQLREPRISTLCHCFAKKFWLCSWNATYDSLLSSNKPFRKPVPLVEMVDFLVDIWEQEGLYD